MENRHPTTPGQPPAALIAALKKVLRPLVRLMLSYQITYPYVINLLKTLYVEVADSEFAVDGKRSSDSRINLLTGVHRKDVKRLRTEAEDEPAIPRSISVGAQLIAYWLGAPAFQEGGKPRPLALRGSSGDTRAVSFDDLVETVCKQDIRPRVILDEWLHLGVASLDAQGCVVLNTGAFTPDKGFDEKAFFFGKNIHDHISAGAHNLRGEKPSHFDRSIYYDKLSAASAQTLAELANEVGMQALGTMNTAALKLQQQDAMKAGKDTRDYRINFGVFNFRTEYTAQESGSEASRQARGEQADVKNKKERSNG